MTRSLEFQIKGRTLCEISPNLWRVEPQGKMRVGVNVVANEKLLTQIKDDISLEQAINVSMLPGVVDPVLTMPDIHQGYGFPIGGVAAFRKDTGVVSPGGVGYDINCGVRLLISSLTESDLAFKSSLKKIIEACFDQIPCGMGKGGREVKVNNHDWKDVLTTGAAWAVKEGYGTTKDLSRIEAGGALKSAQPDKVSTRAKERGKDQLGTLGSGNHFLEIQVVDEVYDKKTAEAFGLSKGQVTVSIHTGSRGLGYQVCTDYLDSTLSASKKYGIELPDRQLASAPLDSDEGQAYLGAMSAAANFAFANRQVIGHKTKRIFDHFFPGNDLTLLYDVCHNIAKFEEVKLGRVSKEVCIHRKGATRAFPPGHPELAPEFRKTGQPVLVPGDMGRYSFVLAGQEGNLEISFGSACHGAGRLLSRSAAKKRGEGREIARELREKGILVHAAGRGTIMEEMPEAYKDVAEVVAVTEGAGIARIVARLRPLAVIKG